MSLRKGNDLIMSFLKWYLTKLEGIFKEAKNLVKMLFFLLQQGAGGNKHDLLQLLDMIIIDSAEIY